MWANKGVTKRTARQQAELAVRILDGRHAADLIQRVSDELGNSASSLGPVDMTRNPLRAAVDRLGKAYTRPPMVTGLGAELATLLGDYSASTTVEKYATAKGRPMPTVMSATSQAALEYRLGACWAGVSIGWSERTSRITLEAVSPDCLDVTYASDDPFEPTVIRHTRLRQPVEQSAWELSVDEYDLTDLKKPIYRVRRLTEQGGVDPDSAGRYMQQDLVGAAYPWRYRDGQPFHRIVITGDPRQPYRTNALIEGTLRVAVLWSHWAAGVRDAGHPQRNVIGLRPAGMSSNTSTNESGISLRPGDVLQWEHTNPDRPGEFHQWGPGFDPAIVGAAVRDYEAALLSQLGLPTSMESTGGAPAELEHEQLERAIEGTYSGCRRLDGEILRRAAAIASAQPGATPIPEGPYGVLYGDEVEDALEAVVPETPETPEAAGVAAEKPEAPMVGAEADDPEED